VSVRFRAVAARPAEVPLILARLRRERYEQLWADFLVSLVKP